MATDFGYVFFEEPMSDAISSAIQLALHGLSDRQNVTSNNIANVQTPGFIAKSTDFESSLKQALNGDKSVKFNPVHLDTTSPTTLAGNNVDFDNETVTAMETELRFKAMIEAMNTKFQVLRSSI